MPLVSFNSNIASVQAQRRFDQATESVSQSFERLSSGLRINRPSDDAAGLATQQTLRTDHRVLSQGLKNLNDGVSLLHIADEALGQLTDVVTRISELATQSASGTLSSSQRRSIDIEAQALSREYYRIARITKFNGIGIFDGSLQGFRVQAGYGTSGGITSGLGGALGTGTFGTNISSVGPANSAWESAVRDINADGYDDIVSAGTGGKINVRVGNGDGTFKAAVSYVANSGVTSAVTIADINNDGYFDVLTSGETAVASGEASALLGNGDGTFRLSNQYLAETYYGLVVASADLNGDGYADLVTGGANTIGGGFTTVRLGNGNGTFKVSTQYASELTETGGIQLVDMNGDGKIDLVSGGSGGGSGRATIRLGTGSGTFGSALSYTMDATASYELAVGDLNGDGILDIATGGLGGGTGSATVRLGVGDGTFKASFSYAADAGAAQDMTLADLDGDGNLDLLTAGGGISGTVTVRIGNGDGSFRLQISNLLGSSGAGTVEVGDINGDGVLDIVSNNGGTSTIALLGIVRDGINPILPFSLGTLAEARAAIPKISNTLNRLLLHRSSIGAYQSRISSALSTVSQSVEQLRAAESRIIDVDVAEESSNLARRQIVSQSAVAILAQANLQPKLALELLT